MATNNRKRYFHIDKKASSEQLFALLSDVESADKDDIDNLMNDSDTEFIAVEEIIQAASTQITSLATPDANLHVVASENQRKKKRAKRKNYGSGKIKVTKQKECHLVPETQINLNEKNFFW